MPSLPIGLTGGGTQMSIEVTALVSRTTDAAGKGSVYSRRSSLLPCLRGWMPHHPLRRHNSSQPQKIPMLGLIRLRRRGRLFLWLLSRYGFELYHAAPRNHILPAVTAPESVIRPLEFRFADGDDLVAIT